MFTLKIATEIFAETLDNFQQSTRLIPRAEVLYKLQVSENEVL